MWFCLSLYRAHKATTRKKLRGSPSPHPRPAMSLEVYILVALAAGVGVKMTCEDIWLAGVSNVVALEDVELVTAGPASSATCEGLKINETLPCSDHVVSSESQPLVFRPHVNLLSSPSSLQAVIAIPAPGLSVHERTPISSNAHTHQSLSESSITYLFCNIQHTHRSPSPYPYNSLCSKSPGGNIAHYPNIGHPIRSMMCVHHL